MGMVTLNGRHRERERYAQVKIGGSKRINYKSVELSSEGFFSGTF